MKTSAMKQEQIWLGMLKGVIQNLDVNRLEGPGICCLEGFNLSQLTSLQTIFVSIFFSIDDIKM